jgi:hypothetical protein
MNEELRKAICDYFEAGDFAECIGVSVEDLIYAFPDEVEDCLDDLKEMIGWRDEEYEE